MDIFECAAEYLKDAEFVERDGYYIFYPKASVSRSDREKLKENGWKLQKHTRTKGDIWIAPKVSND